jgi:hypothetical protein
MALESLRRADRCSPRRRAWCAGLFALLLLGSSVACSSSESVPAAEPVAIAPTAEQAAATTAPEDQGPPPAAADDVPFAHKGLVLGTWSPSATEGFDEQWLDEVELREAFTKQRVDRRVWRGFSTGDPMAPVDALLSDREGPAVGYLYTLVSRALYGADASDRDAVLHVRHRGRVRILLDGQLVLDAPAPASGSVGVHHVPVRLTGPYDVVLAKLGRGTAQLGDSMDIELRVSAPDGSAIPLLTWNTMRPGDLPSDAPPADAATPAERP